MKVEELAYHQTALGELVLRRRPEPMLGDREVFEVKLGDEFLMSSLFTEGEVQLANLGLKGLEGDLDVVVGGLGLGYTAAAALDHPGVHSLLVIDLFEEVIGWQWSGLLPIGTRLVDDSRCELRQGDFFSLSQSHFDEGAPSRLFDAVLLDIDHSPKHHLDESSAGFYTAQGLRALRNQIKPGGIFAMWSDDPVDAEIERQLENVFGAAEGHEIEFPNPYTGGVSLNSVYVARNTKGSGE